MSASAAHARPPADGEPDAGTGAERVPAAVVDEFQARGAVVLRRAFRDWVEPLRAGVAAVMADPSPFERTVRPADGSPPFFQDYCNWDRIEGFRRFVFESPAGAIAAALMQSAHARFFHEHVLVKEPGTTVETPWHHDQPYYCMAGEKTVSLWIALDPVARETSVEYVGGSHRWGRTFRPMRFNGADLFAGDRSERVPDVSARRGDFDLVGWEMAPGDAVAFSFLTLHGAPGNVSETVRRRAFTARFVGDDAVFRDLGGLGSPPFRALALEDGDPFAGPAFPIVYPPPSGRAGAPPDGRA